MEARRVKRVVKACKECWPKMVDPASYLKAYNKKSENDDDDDDDDERVDKYKHAFAFDTLQR